MQNQLDEAITLLTDLLTVMRFEPGPQVYAMLKDLPAAHRANGQEHEAVRLEKILAAMRFVILHADTELDYITITPKEG